MVQFKNTFKKVQTEDERPTSRRRTSLFSASNISRVVLNEEEQNDFDMFLLSHSKPGSAVIEILFSFVSFLRAYRRGSVSLMSIKHGLLSYEYFCID